MVATFAPGSVKLADRLGFDSDANPPWAMVPVGESKRVMLKDGAGLSLQVSRPGPSGIVTFSEQAGTSDRVILLTGIGPGTVHLEARDTTGGVRATLEITVKEQKHLATFIHFVFDKSHRATARGLYEAVQVMEVANKILQPQVNVKMWRRDSGGFSLPFDMARGVPTMEIDFTVPTAWNRPTPGPLPCFASRPPGPLGCMPEETPGSLSARDFEGVRQWNMLANILSHVDPRSDYNIFFVRRLDQLPGPFLTGAYTPADLKGLYLNVCIMPDSAWGQTLAHELGHFLLRGAKFMDRTGHSSGPHDLMGSTLDPDGLMIPKQQANFMNPSGTSP
jgi:hypothetical protein